ncbi:MAG TPA: pyrroline-5-carboxylate reductase [Methylothermaceae bacterium]|nr:pyrroline-5-carboxylate reductase [Methylothermaceae bacterium]
MEHRQIGFIGAGNMASSLIGGLIADGYPADAIHVADIDAGKLKSLQQRFGVQIHADNSALVACCDVVVLAVKPQQMRQVAKGIAAAVRQCQPLIVSIAAGIRESDLERWLGGEAAIVRAMPNTPALVQSGATGLHANARVTAGQRDQAESLLRAVGVTVWVDREELLDAVTALSGSGPAYFFLLMEAMQKAGVELGLSAEAAQLLVEQTALGAAKLALEADVGPGELRQRVTSPGGTTEKAIAVLTEAGFEALIHRALRAAYLRSQELSEQLGEQE